MDDPRQSNDSPHRIRQSIFEAPGESIHIGTITQHINPSQLSPKPTAQKPIVLSIHGIRTTGAWQKSITPILDEAGFRHYPYDYKFFFALKMLFPWIRSRRVVAFREFYESVHERASGVPISLIAHSFGTYIAAKTMVNYAQVSFDQIIFCGSIVQREYDWAGIIARGQARRVLHDYGSKDIWVRIAEWVITDAGPSGQAGFIDPPPNHVIQQMHPNFRHSDHFYPSNFRQRWVPFLRGDAPAMIPPVRPPRFNWKPWMLGGLVLLCLLIVLKMPKYGNDRNRMSITVPSTTNAGIERRVPSSGDCTVQYVKGGYKVDPPKVNYWSTKIIIFKNLKDPEEKWIRGESPNTKSEHTVAVIGGIGSQEEAEKAVRGIKTGVGHLEATDTLTFMAMDGKSGYSDNKGEVELELSCVPR